MQVDLDGKVAFVAGSTYGIGKAVALKLAENHADIVLNGRNSTQAAKVIKEIEILVDHPHLLAVFIDFLLSGADYLPSIKPYAPPVGFDQKIYALEEGALSPTGRTDKDFELSLVYRQGGILEHFLVTIPLRHIFNSEDRGFISHIKSPYEE